MILRPALIALFPLVVCFFIFRRYSLFYPDYLKQLQSVLAGMIAALAILLISPLINIWFSDPPALAAAFLKAAAPEKLAVFVLLLFVFRHYHNFSPLEGALSGMLAGFGFSLVENAAFAINYSTAAFTARMVFTVPMHIASCGILGCHMAQGKLASSHLYRIYYTVSGILIVLALHGAYDFFLLTDSYLMYAASPILLLTVFVFVVKLNRSRLIPGQEILQALGLGYEEWLHLGRQTNYDRWMRRSMGIAAARPVSLLDWHPGTGQMAAIFLFLSASIAGGVWIERFTRIFALSPLETRLVFIFFPFSIAVVIMIVNAVNPDFFKYRELKIPVISNISWAMKDGSGENHVSYDISPVSLFINTYEDAGMGSSLEIEIEIPNLAKANVAGRVIWDKHQPGIPPAGTLVRLTKVNFSFLFLIIVRYTLFRFAKGIIFNLRLPGFESVGRLFVHPVSAMSNDRLYKKGEVIYKEGDIAGNFFFLKKGLVELRIKKSDNEIITINTIPGGTIFGENTLFAPGKRTNTAVAITDALVAAADTSNLHILVKNNTEFAMQLFDTLAKRIAETERSLLAHIKEIDNKKMENFGLYHSLATIVLLSLTGTDMRLDRSYPISKIMTILQNIDDETIPELAMIINKNSSIRNPDDAFDRLDILYMKLQAH